MKPKNIVLIASIAAYSAIGFFLFGCASRPKNAPSTTAVTGDIHTAQIATSQADAKAEVIYQWINSQK